MNDDAVDPRDLAGRVRDPAGRVAGEPGEVGDHPGDDELADHAAGLLEDPRADAVAAHVERCGRCADLLARAGSLGDALDDLGAADRAVDAALTRIGASGDAAGGAAGGAAEGAADDGVPAQPQVPVPVPTAPTTSGGRRYGSVPTVLPAGEPRARSTRRALPDLALAAVLLVLAGLGGVLLLGVLGPRARR